MTVTKCCCVVIQELILDAGQEYRGVVCFDASQMSESQKRHTVRAEGSLSFSYKEHPQKASELFIGYLPKLTSLHNFNDSQSRG